MKVIYSSETSVIAMMLTMAGIRTEKEGLKSVEKQGRATRQGSLYLRHACPFEEA